MKKTTKTQKSATPAINLEWPPGHRIMLIVHILLIMFLTLATSHDRGDMHDMLDIFYCINWEKLIQRNLYEDKVGIV
jgi:hypothetical protein